VSESGCAREAFGSGSVGVNYALLKEGRYCPSRFVQRDSIVVKSSPSLLGIGALCFAVWASILLLWSLQQKD
jgi:hypothetical protein